MHLQLVVGTELCHLANGDENPPSTIWHPDPSEIRKFAEFCHYFCRGKVELSGVKEGEKKKYEKIGEHLKVCDDCSRNFKTEAGEIELNENQLIKGGKD